MWCSLKRKRKHVGDELTITRHSAAQILENFEITNGLSCHLELFLQVHFTRRRWQDIWWHRYLWYCVLTISLRLDHSFYVLVTLCSLSIGTSWHQYDNHCVSSALSSPQFALLFKPSQDKILCWILSPNKMLQGCSGNCFSSVVSRATCCVETATAYHRYGTVVHVSWSDGTCLTLFSDTTLCAQLVPLVYRSIIK